MTSSLVFVDLGFFVIALFLLRKISNRNGAPLPPGPRKIPFIGNLLDVPSSQEWSTFSEWGKRWGPIVSISVLGKTMIILNSFDLASEILEKKSLVSSDRPVIQMGGELVGWKNALVLIPYGKRFRNYRRLMHKAIGSHDSMSKFNPAGEIEAHRFLKRVLDTPDDFEKHIRTTAGSIILRITYGYKIEEKDDPLVQVADAAMQQFALSTAPGGFLVNVVPALKFIPEWIPGAGFKQTAVEWARTLTDLVELPFEYVKNKITSGNAENSFMSELMAEPELSDAEIHDIKWASASLYAGGADTTVASLCAFFLAMSRNPKVMRIAQKEIDEVIGNDRLLKYADRTALPYINALVKEVFRWHSVASVGIPHRVTESFFHEDYLIPTGSLIIPNIWNMAHDPNVYPDPFAFEPARFLGDSPQLDPTNFVFGFGRRICPGLILADTSVFMSIAMTLAVFDIAQSPNTDNVITNAIHEQTSGSVSHPKPFHCLITPRSAKARDLILDL